MLSSSFFPQLTPSYSKQLSSQVASGRRLSLSSKKIAVSAPPQVPYFPGRSEWAPSGACYIARYRVFPDKRCVRFSGTGAVLFTSVLELRKLVVKRANLECLPPVKYDPLGPPPSVQVRDPHSLGFRSEAGYTKCGSGGSPGPPGESLSTVSTRGKRGSYEDEVRTTTSADRIGRNPNVLLPYTT